MAETYKKIKEARDAALTYAQIASLPVALGLLDIRVKLGKEVNVPKNVNCHIFTGILGEQVKDTYETEKRKFKIPYGAQAVLWYRAAENKPWIPVLIDDVRRARFARIQVDGDLKIVTEKGNTRFEMEDPRYDFTISNETLDLGGGVKIQHYTPKRHRSSITVTQ